MPKRDKEAGLPIRARKKATFKIPTDCYQRPPVLYQIDGREGRSGAIWSFPSANAPPHLITSTLIYTGMERAIREVHPDFPAPFSTPTPPAHKIVPIDGRGLGMVAVKNIAAGELIVRERPLVVWPNGVSMGSREYPLGGFQILIESMHPDNRRAFYALANSKRNCNRIIGIISTNGFGLRFAMPGDKGPYMGVGRDISRVNHSCVPNSFNVFDLRTCTFCLRATHPIAAGDEVTICYKDTFYSPRIIRQDTLRVWNFTCTCKLCALPAAVREAYYIAWEGLLGHERSKDDAKFARWLLDGAPYRPEEFGLQEDSDEFRWSMMACEIMEQLECVIEDFWEPALSRTVKGYSVLEDEANVRRFATRAAELRMAFTGDDGGWRAVADHPKETDWWARLGSKRKKC